jgi:2-haloacid dehalogenase
MDAIRNVHTLTFDVFGTILDLTSAHVPKLREFLATKSSDVTAEALWDRWRARQRVEQFQDNLFCAGHFGYLDSSRRALIYSLRAAKLPFDDADVNRIMAGWRDLRPFPDVLPGLELLRNKFKIVALSNGEKKFLAEVVSQCIGFEFDAAISVDEVSAFKPSPQVYRYAARVLTSEPWQLMMVSAHSFDAVGARASGCRAAYVNRYDLPFDESPYQYDVEARDFRELAEKLMHQAA